jgi:hypothetical protein
MPIPVVRQGASERGRDVANDTQPEEGRETDRPSRNLCTLVAGGLGKGCRRSPVDPVYNETQRTR